MMKTNFRNSLSPRRSPRAAFTLVEMLIVLAIIALLGTVVVVNLDKIFEGAKMDTAKAFCNGGLDTALVKYKMDTGNYPNTGEGLNALLVATGAKASKWRGPYIEKLPDDPWGNPYQYRFPGTKNTGKYDLFSYGPDGTESGDDIGNWDK